MTRPDGSGRITGPLKSWYDLHEALTHEVIGLADMASSVSPGTLAPFAKRFWAFERELRNHSEVEDGIMFPAIVARGGSVDQTLEEDHRVEQLATYALGCMLLQANATGTDQDLHSLVTPARELRDSLTSHLEREESSVLTQVDGLFSDSEQSALFRSIITSLPPDPDLQPWVARALTPEHLEARLRNIASSMSEPALTDLMTQIHHGVDPGIWAVVEEKTPDLAALVHPEEATTGVASSAQ